LKDVIGRHVGSTEFAYSAALTGKHEAWTSRRIVDFAVSPSAMYPGSSMPPVALTPEFRRDLENYLDAQQHQ